MRIDHRSVWLFTPGADAGFHQSVKAGDVQVFIQDLEDFTPPLRRPEARALSPTLFKDYRALGAMVAVRINRLDSEGLTDLRAVMPHRPDIISLPKAGGAKDIQELATVLDKLEQEQGITPGSTEILPVCETALGVVKVIEMAQASSRVRCALLGSEDLTADLMAERSVEGTELDYARRRFVLECRATGIEPIDAPFTFARVEDAAKEARFARRLGYRAKSGVRAEHAAALKQALWPQPEEVAQARKVVSTFEAGRARGEDKINLDGHWLEVPTYLNAKRLLARVEG